MPTIVWLTAGAGVWLAALSATCALLTVAKRADAAAAAGRDTLSPGCRGLPEKTAAGPIEPPGRIVVGVREPALAGPMRAIAPDGPDRRRRRRPPGGGGVD